MAWICEKHGEGLGLSECSRCLKEALCQLLYACEAFLASPNSNEPTPKDGIPLSQCTTVMECRELTKAYVEGKKLVDYEGWLGKEIEKLRREQ